MLHWLIQFESAENLLDTFLNIIYINNLFYMYVTNSICHICVCPQHLTIDKLKSKKKKNAKKNPKIEF